MTTFSLNPSNTLDIDSIGALTIDSSSTIGIGTDDVDQNINISTASINLLMYLMAFFIFKCKS